MKGCRVMLCIFSAVDGYFACLFSTDGFYGFAGMEACLIVLGLIAILTEPKS